MPGRRDSGGRRPLTYDEFIQQIAGEVIAATRWGTATKPFVRSFHARLGEAPGYGRTSAEAYDDVGSCVRRQSASRLRGKVVDAWIRGRRALRRRVRGSLNDLLLAPRHLARLPELRAAIDGPRAPRVPDLRGAAPGASIVILSYNRLDYLKTALASFHATVGCDDYELLVVDNGSTDGSAAFAREAAERGIVSRAVIRRKNHGVAGGCNSGFAHAHRDTSCYVKLDSDILIATPGWLPRIRGLLDRNPSIGVLSMNVLNNPQIQAIPAQSIDGEEVLDWARWTQGAAGMTIPRRVFAEIGYLCEEPGLSYTLDDVDYHARLVRAGYDAYYVKALRAFERHDLDASSFRSYDAWKQRQAKAFNRSIQGNAGRAYDRRTRGLGLFYAKYEGCTFPEGARVIEID
jgi:GT2 family glycosyltransferase